MNRIISSWRSSVFSSIRRHSSCCNGEHQLSESEKKMVEMLKTGITGCSRVEVHDVSNGCGSMFDVVVEATSFNGKSKVAQHKAVTSILRKEIESMHGLTIKTRAI